MILPSMVGLCARITVVIEVQSLVVRHDRDIERSTFNQPPTDETLSISIELR